MPISSEYLCMVQYCEEGLQEHRQLWKRLARMCERVLEDQCIIFPKFYVESDSPFEGQQLYHLRSINRSLPKQTMDHFHSFIHTPLTVDHGQRLTHWRKNPDWSRILT